MLELAIAGARLLEAGGGAVLFGAALLLRLAATPVADAPWSRPLLTAAALAAAVGSVLALGLQTVGMAGSVREGLDPGALGGVVRDTAFGRGVVVRLVAAVVAAGLVRARDGRATRTGIAALGAVVLASLAWSGHGAADEGARGAIHLAGDLAHLLAAGAWLGALAALAMLSLGAGGGGARGRAALGGALGAFSRVGLAVVAALLASGLVNGWFLVGPERWRTLGDDAWGRLLLLKLALFAAMLALAALNRWRLTPALAAAGDGGGAGLRALRWSVGLEAALGAGVLAAAAVMGGLAPPAAQG